MTDRNYSDHQKKIIRRYYDHRDEVDEQKLAEAVTNLYLAEGKKRAKQWITVRDLMLRLNVPPSRVEHIMQSDNPALVAEVVKDIQAGLIKPAPKTTPPSAPPSS